MTSRPPDFRRVYMLANEILVSTRIINVFPFNIKSLVKEQSDAQLCSYRKAEEKYHVPIRDFGSDSAHLEEYCGANIIFYNNKEQKTRIRFSIGHELGHMLLGHKMNLKKSDPLYGVQEVEANCFSAQLLMPEQIIRECSRRGYMISVEYIMDSFGVSKMAAEKRRETLSKTNHEWKSRSEKMYDDIIIERNIKTIDTIAPRRDIYDICFSDEEYEKQQERDSWLDGRGRW